MKKPTAPPTSHPELPTEDVTVSVAHVHAPTAIGHAEVAAADIATEHKHVVQLPPAPHPGYRPCGRPPWGEP